MKKTLLSLLLMASALMAEVSNVEVSTEFVEANKIKIIDIRTEGEWKKMGIIPTAHLLTFFDEGQSYEPRFFLKDLDEIVDKDEQFAIISNTASRTKLVSNYLGNKHNYNVVNLIGGMEKLIEDGYEVEVYDPDKELVLEEEIEQVESEESNISIDDTTEKLIIK
ncbi:MAG: Unknown protein [uncultured Sulfurovum sp.]|uniref:Rhodanese domain-containing protein n=1 Tax=uncultured Sulfurovum sp. TaxID=269237 RepID=A0A6S6TDF3_9BACT|nr:MAG: Unknown protein [uncultured Sulfurovum sp.]